MPPSSRGWGCKKLASLLSVVRRVRYNLTTWLKHRMEPRQHLLVLPLMDHTLL